MRLEFDSITELSDFFDFCSNLHARNERLNAALAALSVAEPVMSPLFDAPLPDIAMPEAAAEKTADTPAVADQKRKRRTKAEMEAARAAEQQTAEAVVDAVVEAAESAEQRPAANPFAQPETAAEFAPAVEPESAMEVADFIKSRLCERPEVSQVDHLNMARTFIGKHGMDKYNQSFALAGLTNNVMGYSTADCATHAAALDFLSLE